MLGVVPIVSPLYVSVPPWVNNVCVFVVNPPVSVMLSVPANVRFHFITITQSFPATQDRHTRPSSHANIAFHTKRNQPN